MVVDHCDSAILNSFLESLAILSVADTSYSIPAMSSWLLLNTFHQNLVGRAAHGVAFAPVQIVDASAGHAAEPTAGLDPQERRRFHNLLADIGSDTVVILSTHIVDDVSDLCSNMAIMGAGKILMKGQPNEVVAQLEGSIYSKLIDRSALIEHESNYRVLFSTLVGGRTKIHIVSDSNPGDGFEASGASLEDVYFSTLHDNKISVAA